jgi:hypothetical protein
MAFENNCIRDAIRERYPGIYFDQIVVGDRWLQAERGDGAVLFNDLWALGLHDTDLYDLYHDYDICQYVRNDFEIGRIGDAALSKLLDAVPVMEPEQARKKPALLAVGALVCGLLLVPPGRPTQRPGRLAQRTYSARRPYGRQLPA